MFFDDLDQALTRPPPGALLLVDFRLSILKHQDGLDLQHFPEQGLRTADATSLLQILERIDQEIRALARDPFQDLGDYLAGVHAGLRPLIGQKHQGRQVPSDRQGINHMNISRREILGRELGRSHGSAHLGRGRENDRRLSI